MGRRKRPYLPKVKGCYQCSQRRIDCDGTTPSCLKCASKAITCDGFGFKYKFRNEFAKRGANDPGQGASKCRSLNATQKTIQLDGGQSELDVLRGSRKEKSLTVNNHGVSVDHILDIDYQGLIDSLGGLGHLDAVEGHFGTSPPDSGLVAESRATTAAPSLTLDLYYIEPWKAVLLKYFSDHIAPEMVVVDDVYNGWRHWVLPVACSNEMVMDAVLAVSAFHLSGKTPRPCLANPATFYAQAIKQLQDRRDLVHWDLQTKQLVILAIVVLLVAVMVNGCSDFPILFQMLQSALDAVGGEIELNDGGAMANFLLRQIHKMRVYAAPLVSQDAGVHAIIHQGEESFDCLRYYRRLYPNHNHTFDLITNLRQQAFTMYLNRALPGCLLPNVTLTELTESFKKALELFPEGSPGKHVLVWAAFIAALESRTPEHRLFFEEFLETQYYRNGFANISRALELLRKVWAEDGVNSWPSLLPDFQVFIM